MIPSKSLFDWTINLGHILTFVGFLFTGFLAYQNLDKRVILVEQAQLFQHQRDQAQDSAALAAKTDLKEALQQVHTSLEKLSDKIDRVKGR